MFGDYDLDEVVKYDGRIYIIVKVFQMDWFGTDTDLYYGLIDVKNIGKEWPYILIPACQIKKLNEQERKTWSVLHGKIDTKNSD